MLGQIKGRPVCAAHALDPSVGGEELGVPAVAGVMGHFVVHVLTEANLGGIGANLV